MSYENAPATHLVATCCAFCGRSLVDAHSLKVGVGPVCRKKYAIPASMTEEGRIRANKVIYLIAAHQTGSQVVEYLNELEGLGLSTLAKRIRKRLPYMVKLSYQGDRLYLKTDFPMSGNNGSFRGFLNAIRKITGRRFHGETKENSFPRTERRAVWEVLQSFFPGAKALGPKGEFDIPERQ